MKHIAKKISCIALTAALLAGGMPVQVLADSPKTQQEQPGEALPQEVLPEEIQPETPEQEGTGSVLPDGESQMQEETHKPQEPPQEVPQEVPQEQPQAQPEEAPQEQPQEQAEEETAEPEEPGRQVPQAGVRVLLEDNFQDASGWKVNKPDAVKIGGGQAVIKGAGPNNAMISNGMIAAQNFLIQTDLVIGSGNTNCNAKIGFKAEDGFESQRLQLRFDFPHNKVFLEKVTGNTVNTTYGTAEVTVSEGTHKLAVEVQDNTITAWLDEKEIITTTHDEIGKLEKGKLLFAGQYPAQDFAMANLHVTTNEQPSGKECKVTLETYTDGVLDAEHKGGTLTADKLSGYSGDYVTLTPKAKHGYVFEKYETSTDNLVPIENNRFQLNEKFPNITVRAYFKTRVPGKDELFFEDFGGDLGTQPDGIRTQDGELVVEVPDGSSSNAYKPEVDWTKISGNKGYRISVDARRMTGESGTIQIAFRGGDSFDSRYVVAVNSQGSAMLRKLHNGKNEELKKSGFQMTDKFAHVVMEVKGSEMKLFIDNKEMFSYTDNGNWSEMQPAVQLINMTAGAPAAFDNLLVEQICEKKPVEVVSIFEGKEDEEHKAGTATSDVTEAEEGQKVTLTATAKAGYRLKEYQIENVEVKDGIFVMPAGDFEKLVVKAVFETDKVREGKTFYVDSENGDDSAEGTSEKTAWKTLDKVKEYGTFVPGDKILLKRGSVFTGQQLAFQGMGAKGNPIEVSAYGEGKRPKLEGNGEVENVVSLYNQEYVEIRNLEITNLDTQYNTKFGLNESNNTKKALRAVNVSIRNFGTASGIAIEDCYIHDINGNINLKWNGGVFFDVKADIQNGQLTGVPSKYDNISISGCTFERVDRSAIKLVSSQWCNQWEKNDPGVPVHWYPSTNVVVEGNYMEYIGGDGITVRDTDGALIEHNLAKDCRFQNTGYNVGIWPFEAANTVLQYNEAYETHGTTDGQGLDCDHASSNSVMQYNYSHNNEGGFMLIMGGYPHTGATVRYNISQNDRDKTFEFAQGLPKGTMIYNNTIYSDQVLDKGVFFLSNTGAGVGVNDGFAFNNVFSYPQGQKAYGGDTQGAGLVQEHMKIYNNAYTGGMSAFEADANPLQADDLGIVKLGSAPETHEGKDAVTGTSGLLDGYKLQEGSVLIDKGLTVDEAWKHFGGSKLVDGRNNSPRDLFEDAKAQNYASIDCVMGNNFPQVAGVVYDQDFFGGSLAKGKPDIGAAEYQSKEPEKPEPPQTALLEGISIQKAPEKTTYTEGETFNPKGMEVEAKFSDGNTKDVTGEISYSEEPLKASDKEMVISYTYEGVTKDAVQAITVKAKGEPQPPTPEEPEKPQKPENPDASVWEIEAVEIVPEKAELKTGESKQFTVKVTGKGEFSKEVSWELVGKHHEDTYIDEKGTLYVSKAETAGEVKVKAVSKADAKKSDEAVVKIKKAQTQVPGTNVNNNGNNTTTGKPAGNQGVQTGDESHVVMLLGLLAVSGGVLLICKRKRQ